MLVVATPAMESGTPQGRRDSREVPAAPSGISEQRKADTYAGGRRRTLDRLTAARTPQASQPDPNHASPHREGPANARRKYRPLPTLRLPCPSGRATPGKTQPGMKAGDDPQGVQTSPPPKGSGDRRRFTRDECVVPLARP